MGFHVGKYTMTWILWDMKVYETSKSFKNSRLGMFWGKIFDHYQKVLAYKPYIQYWGIVYDALANFPSFVNLK